MGYKMIEISSEQKDGIMEHAHKAYEHLGKLIESIEEACSDGSMGQRMGYREDDEWYIRRMNRDRGNYDYDRMGERRYSRPYSRMGNRDPYFE